MYPRILIAIFAIVVWWVGVSSQAPGAAVFAPGVISMPESHDDYIS
jgi:hypothetical protein